MYASNTAPLSFADPALKTGVLPPFQEPFPQLLPVKDLQLGSVLTSSPVYRENGPRMLGYLLDALSPVFSSPSCLT